MLRFRRHTVACAAVTALLTSAVANWMPASSITDCGTLQDLIDAGKSGITQHGLRFYDFTYTGSTNCGVVPCASQISVSDVSDLCTDDSHAPTVGIRFSFGWTAAAGEVVDSLISYRVAPVDCEKMIGCVDLQFNGAVLPHRSDAFAAVTETVRRRDGEPIVGCSRMGLLSVFNDGCDDLPGDTNLQCLQITPSTELIVTKNITLRAGQADKGDCGGLATVSCVDNSFCVVPEPGSGLLIMGSALVSFLVTRRRSAPGEVRRAAAQ